MPFVFKERDNMPSLQYLIYIVTVMAVFPFVCFLIEWLRLRQRRRARYSVLALLCKWFIFWSLGIHLIVTVLLSIFGPLFPTNMAPIEYISAFNQNNIILMSMSIFGLLGILSLPLPHWRKAAAFGSGFFLAGFTALYFSNSGITLSWQHITLLVCNLWTFFMVLVCLIRSPERK